MNTIEKHRAFLDSLDEEKGLPDEWRLIIPNKDIRQAGDQICHASQAGAGFRLEWVDIDPQYYGEVYGSWATLDGQIVARRRAESRQTPDLKENVKELVRDAMQAERSADEFETLGGKVQITKYRDEFRALCEPEKDSKEAGT